jgi:cytochrome c oxidase assembly protein subunit 15
MNLREGFTVWRELGMNADGQPITFAALTGIHYVHRLCAYLVLVALVGLAWQLWSRPGARSSARWLLALAGLQLATGLSNVVLDWPLLSAVGHTGGAAALVVVMTGLLAGTRTAPSSVGAPALTVPRTSP